MLQRSYYRMLLACSGYGRYNFCMNKSIIGAIVIILIGAGVWYYTAEVPDTDTIQESTKIVPKWSFENLPQVNESDPPQTKVTLTVGQKNYDAGTYAGSCAEIGASGGVDGKGLVAGEVSGVQCWFAGGGDEVGLFQENGKLTLKRGLLEEPQGDGSEGFRGNFTSFLELGQ